MDPAKPLSLAAVRRKWRYDLGFIGLVLAGLAAQAAIAAYAFPVWWALAPLLAFMAFMGRLSAPPMSRYFAMRRAAFLDEDSRRICPAIAKMVDDHARAARIPTPEFHLMNHDAPAACAWGSGAGRRGVGLRITLAKLPPAFVSAMLAHEVAHLKNRDEGVFTVILSLLRAFFVSTFVVLITSGFQMVNFLAAPPHLDLMALRPFAALFVVVITFLVVTTVAESHLPRLLQQHEFAADALGAVISGDPVSLICALASLEINEGSPSAVEREPGEVQTHPALQDRVNALMRLALEMKKIRL